MQTKLGRKFWISMLIFGLMGQVAWVVENMYFNVFIYKMFHATAADISLMVMASAVTAALTTIIMGAVSDKVGKRKAFMSAGYIIWGISIIAFAYIRSVALTIVMDCVMTYFGSTANDAAYNAWLTDRGDSTNRGKIEGVNSMMPLVAVLVVFGGFMSFNLDEHSAWVTIYYVIGIATALIGVLGWFIIEDDPGLKKSEESMGETLAYSFRPSVAKENKTLYLTLLNFAVFGISIQIFMPYLIIYYEKTLGLTNYVMIFAPAILLAAVATVFYGRLYDSRGFMKSILPVAAMLLVGYTILYFTQAHAALQAFIGSLIAMTGYLAGMSIFGAMIRDNIPEGRAGQFQGVRIIGQVFVPGLIGPAVSAWLLRNADVIVNSDGTESFLPGKVIWSASAAVIVILVAVLMLTMRERKEN
ncbi:MAG: MFS transporter [Mogibacterium sp.]|uniref:Major facilitator superfamily MFS_1 n=1 Tax=uncultured bacterium Contig1762 TaxID=1393506 RepID=W0FNK5_9BACT|nr:major facilitator superfamily MFS_1 [uncultured bacterium Contig1762]MBQ1329365.1 MFS transporter [Mogibacterium sp.]